MGKLKTLNNDPFQDDAAEILNWAYGPEARTRFFEFLSGGQRAGQAFMNALYEQDIHEYDRIAGSLADPFYQDNKLPAAIDRLTMK